MPDVIVKGSSTPLLPLPDRNQSSLSAGDPATPLSNEEEPPEAQMEENDDQLSPLHKVIQNYDSGDTVTDKTINQMMEIFQDKDEEQTKAIANAKTKKRRTPLHFAASLQSTNDDMTPREIVRMLIEKKGETDAVDDSGMTPLHCAAYWNNLGAAKALIEHFLTQGDIYATKIFQKLDLKNRTPFVVACAQKSKKVYTLFLKHKELFAASLQQDHYGNTFLHYLARSERSIVADFESVDEWWKANVQNNDGVTPLKILVERGFSEIVEKMCDGLCQNREKVDITPSADDFTKKKKIRKDNGHLLHLAASVGNLQSFVALRYKLCYEVDEKYDGMTPLHLTAQVNAWESAVRFLDYGIERGISAKELCFEENDQRENLLAIAFAYNHPTYITKLIEKMEKDVGCDDFDASHTSAIQKAIQCGSIEGLQDLLQGKTLRNTIKLDEILEEENENGESVLHFAARSGCLNVVEELLKKKVVRQILNATAAGNRTPLHVAARNDHAKICEVLLRKGANPYARANGMTPFDLAITMGSLNSAEVLRKYCSVNGERECKMSPLHYAAASGKIESVHYLLDSANGKIDLAKVTNDVTKRTALDIAIEKNNEDVAKELLSHKDWRLLMDKIRFVFSDETNKVEIGSPKTKREEISEEKRKLVTPMRLLIDKFPKLAADVMNKCIDPDQAKKEICYDFTLIDDSYVVEQEIDGQTILKAGYNSDGSVIKEANYFFDDRAKKRTRLMEEHPLRLMAKSRRKDTRKLLEHELVTTFLEYRWTNGARKNYLLFSFVPFCLFFFCYILMFVFMLGDQFVDSKGQMIAGNETGNTTLQEQISKSKSNFIRDRSGTFESFCPQISAIVLLLLVILVIYLLIKEIFQWWQTRALYWKRGNLIELVVLLLSSIIIVWRIVELFQGKKYNFLFWPIAVLSFLGLTLNLLMLLSTFFFLLQNQDVLENPLISLIKVSVMSTGEFDFSSLFYGDDVELLSVLAVETPQVLLVRIASFIVFLLFIVTITILFMNLYTGVAVDDVAEIKEEATVNKLSMQLSLILIQGIICEKLMRNAKYKIIVDFAKDKSSTKIEDKNDQPKRINLFSNPNDEWEELLRKRDESTNRSMETRMTEMAAHLLEITRMLKASQAGQQASQAGQQARQAERSS
ncbi:unnamed protein product, partial [Mesorhabditis belari]|uniref:Ion transport domain-containing protein n=1 Tax=Mesorhabditis belari TaxID=2138241 RepID=A0AAF3F9J2_9BILA